MKKRLWAFTLFTALSAAIVPHAKATFVPVERPNAVLAARTAAPFPVTPGMPDPNQIFTAVNQARANNNLPPLQRNSVLSTLATERAQDMSANRYYAHKSPSGTYFYDVLGTNGYKVDYGCENLDLAFTLDTDRYLNDWLNSRAGHRECLLNADTTDAGYAVATIASINGQDIPSYVVVAIHSTAPTQK